MVKFGVTLTGNPRLSIPNALQNHLDSATGIRSGQPARATAVAGTVSALKQQLLNATAQMEQLERKLNRAEQGDGRSNGGGGIRGGGVLSRNGNGGVKSRIGRKP